MKMFNTVSSVDVIIRPDDTFMDVIVLQQLAVPAISYNQIP
jgi:hypothetical protein